MLSGWKNIGRLPEKGQNNFSIILPKIILPSKIPGLRRQRLPRLPCRRPGAGAGAGFAFFTNIVLVRD
jgi:hypothetical protein